MLQAFLERLVERLLELPAEEPRDQAGVRLLGFHERPGVAELEGPPVDRFHGQRPSQPRDAPRRLDLLKCRHDRPGACLPTELRPRRQRPIEGHRLQLWVPLRPPLEAGQDIPDDLRRGGDRYLTLAPDRCLRSSHAPIVDSASLSWGGRSDSDNRDPDPSKGAGMSMPLSTRSSAGIARWAALGGILFFFLWFLSSLRRTVRRHEGEDGFLTALTTIGGAVYATLALAALAVNQGIRTMSDDTYHHQVFPGLIHGADDAGYVLHATGGAGASAMIIAASLAAMRAAAVRSWVGWLGIVAGILALGSIVFFPQAAIGIWILVVSGGMFIRGGRGERQVA